MLELKSRAFLPLLKYNELLCSFSSTMCDLLKGTIIKSFFISARHDCQALRHEQCCKSVRISLSLSKVEQVMSEGIVGVHVKGAGIIPL